jgi:hypothetical protein
MRRCIPSLSAILLGATIACSPAARQGAATAAAGAQYQPSKLILFGGLDHKTYLGCLNCSEYASDSVLNTYGQHGNSYSSESIWNAYSQFGSAYSSYSSCNAYATDPPVIVDQEGHYYGRLTLNTYHAQFGVGAKYYKWLKTTVCREN